MSWKQKVPFPTGIAKQSTKETEEQMWFKYKFIVFYIEWGKAKSMRDFFFFSKAVHVIVLLLGWVSLFSENKGWNWKSHFGYFL